MIELTLLKQLIDVSETNESKECDFCCFGSFLNKGFKFQTYVGNRCQDLLKIFMNLSNVSLLKAKSADYFCIITGFSKREALKLLQKNRFD